MGTKQKNRRARRAGQRGAMMVETVVAMPFFILIFAGTVFVQKLYATKLATMAEARNTAWQAASNGCAGLSPTELKNVGTPLGESADPDVDFGKGASWGATSVSTEEFGDAVVTREADVVASGMLGGYSKRVRSTVVVACNEQRRDGSLLDAISYLWVPISSKAEESYNEGAEEKKQ